MKKNTLLLAFILLSYTKSIAQSIVFTPEQFGARTDDNQDDAHAFAKIALTAAMAKYEKVTIKLSKGRYNIAKAVRFLDIMYDLHFSGTTKTEILVSDNVGFIVMSKATPLVLAAEVVHGHKEVRISGATNEVRKGDILHVSSNTPFETGWGYKENDVHSISAIQGDRIITMDTFLFNYTPSREKVQVKVYAKRKLTLNNMNFLLSPHKEGMRSEAMQIRGVMVDVDGLKVEHQGKDEYYHNGLSIGICIGLNFRNIQFNGLQYGVIASICRNVRAFDTKAYFTRHAYVPSTATSNVYIKNLYGFACHSVMDAHVAFNVVYENVVDSMAIKYPGCRALGLTIKNARITMANKSEQLYAYWSVQTLTAEYNFMYTSADQYFEQVQWVGRMPGRFNGITAFSCRTLSLKNCTTHNVSYYGDQHVLKSLEISDSRIGNVFSGSQKLAVRNVTMDGRLVPNGNFVFWVGGIGKTEISDSHIIGYDPKKTYLFMNFHNNPKANSVVMKNVTVQQLKGFTNKLVDPGMKYSSLQLTDVKMAGFTDKNPKELNFKH